ncbi:MAG: PAS domain S-box protein [Candidatus Hodarchaeota archaeon]
MTLESLLDRQDISENVMEVIKRGISKIKRLEAKIRELETQYPPIIDVIPDPLLIVDKNFRLLFLNKALKQWIKELDLKTDIIDQTLPKAFPFLSEKVQVEYCQVFNTGKTLITESSTLIKGEEIIAEVSKIPIFEAGEVKRVVTIIHNITDRKGMEKILRENEARYRTLVETSPDAVTMTDLEGKIIVANQQAIMRFGAKQKDELIGKSAFDIIAPEDHQRALENLKKTLELGAIRGVKYQFLNKDGSPYPVELSASLLRDTNGNPTAFIAVTRDITERKQMEEELYKRGEQYRILVETMTDGLAVIDENNIITYVNNSFCEMIGYSSTELLRTSTLNYLDEENQNILKKQLIGRRRGEEQAYELVWVRKDGKPLYTLISPKAIRDSEGKFIGSFGVITNITERKQAEWALKKSERFNRELVEASPLGIIYVDSTGTIEYENRAMKKIMGVPEETISPVIGMNLFELPTIDEMVLFSRLKRVLQGETIYGESMHYRSFMGVEVDLEVYAAPLMDDQNHLEGVILMVQDVTERKRVEADRRHAEAALRESEEKFRAFFHNANDIIFLNPFPEMEDVAPPFIEVNQAVIQTLGYSREELLTMTSLDIIKEIPSTGQNVRQELLDQGISTFERIFLSKNGNEIPVEIKARLFNLNQQKVVLAIARDISERKQAEKVLQQVKLQEERYHTMLSHFIKNDLHEIINQVEYIALDKSKGKLDTENRKKVIDSILRSSRTIDTVNKIFAVLQSSFEQQKRKLSLLEIIKETVIEAQGNLSPTYPVKIKQDSLSIWMWSDFYLKDVFIEILSFILSSNKKRVLIEGTQLPSQFCVTIHDVYSEPIPNDVCVTLTGRITDKWESQGHFIGISLASVIMQHYGGQMTIQPGEHQGNKFELFFPSTLIHSKNPC